MPALINNARWRKIGFWAAKLLFIPVFLVFMAIWVLFFFSENPLEKVVNFTSSPVLFDKDGTIIHARLSSDEEWCMPIPLEEMGYWLPKILVEIEDKRFFKHGGVDFIALARASLQNIQSQRIVSGASTITSQLVRLSIPRQRTFTTKIWEFFGAWHLENHLAKNDILELYLNRAPFGGNIRGVEAASRMYFGKRAKELSLGEASLLIGLLKGPTLYRPDRNPKAALKRRQNIIKQVALSENFPQDLTSLALEEELPIHKPAMPTSAWHFADMAFEQLARWQGQKKGGNFFSTLDTSIQMLIENTLKTKLMGEIPEITAAAIVIENQTGSIIAYVGNARFNLKLGKEWVDCARAARSPGSTLKPFVYLAGLETGQIVPATMLADTPLYLDGEAPRNFDRTYRGPVTAERALVDSINVPAVRVFRMIGMHAMQSRFRMAGFTLLDRVDANHGDSLVLGAGEVTLLELARAHTTLANMGIDNKLAVSPWQLASSNKVLANTNNKSLDNSENIDATGANWLNSPPAVPVNIQKRIYTAEACFLLAEMLNDTSRLPVIDQILQQNKAQPIAFKTGTSYGLRDAWSVAYNPDYTVAVWFGRADGGANQNLVGISMAAPVSIEILKNLSVRQQTATDTHETQRSWYTTPQGVAKKEVCTLSGMEPSAFCPSTKISWYIPKVWRTVPCSLHQMQDGNIKVVWPPELESFQHKRFTGEDLSRQLFIASPLPDAKYLLLPGVPTPVLALKVEGATYPVHWYSNGIYLGEQKNTDIPMLFNVTKGKHEIAVLDAKSRTGRRILQAESVQDTKLDIPMLGE